MQTNFIFVTMSGLKNKIMRKILLWIAVTIISFIPTQVLIAGEPNDTSLSMPSAVTENWSGAYLAGIIGFANGDHPNNNFNLTPNLLGFNKLSLNNNYADDQAATGGVALGMQQQFNRFIIGFEGDWTYTGIDFSMINPDLMLSDGNGTSFGINGDAINAGGSSFQTKAKLDWIGTIRPRIGYIVIPKLAIYGTGGFAYGEINAALNENKIFTPSSSGKANDMAVGWSIGAGTEYKLTPKLLVRGEYLFVNLTANNVSMPFAGGTASQNAEFNVHLAKLGIVYKFW